MAGAGRSPTTTRRWRPAALAAFLAVQTIAAFFFVGDVLSDAIQDPASSHTVYEALVSLALVLGVTYGTIELRRTIATLRAQETALATAQGELAAVIGRQFDDWGLTPAERDVGMLALKGFDVAEIATLRGAAQGTVRAQLARIYAKGGVPGRPQFAAFFVEDLLGGGL